MTHPLFFFYYYYKRNYFVCFLLRMLLHSGLNPLCASTTTASVQSLAIHFHSGHVICKNSLQDLLDVLKHCFHNRYPFFFLLILWHCCQSFFLPEVVLSKTLLNLVVNMYSLSNHDCYYCENHYCCHHNLFPFVL